MISTSSLNFVCYEFFKTLSWLNFSVAILACYRRFHGPMLFKLCKTTILISFEKNNRIFFVDKEVKISVYFVDYCLVIHNYEHS